MASVLNDPELERMLDQLHARSAVQTGDMYRHFTERFSGGASVDFERGEDKAYLADKLVALERDKAEFCYLLCRSLNARRVVEVGTSYGVSTLYLAAAVRDNGHAPGDGVVIATEHEPDKARQARGHFTAAGLSSYIELREGDLRDTLDGVEGPVDFVLVDIWTSVARPALERVAPALRRGAIVVCDNTKAFHDAYGDYFAYIDEPANRLKSLTLPFEGGLELTVRC